MPAGRLEVNVLDGTRLKDTQTFGKQDPYCVLRVGEQRDRTKTCADGGTRPRWNERFRFSLAGHESALDLEVWNANKMTSDAYIGAALVSLGDVFASGTQDAAVPLRDKKNKIAGNVMLVLRFAPDEHVDANRPGDARSNPHAGLTNQQAVVQHEPPRVPHVVTGNPHAQPAIPPVYRPAAAAAPAYAAYAAPAPTPSPQYSRNSNPSNPYGQPQTVPAHQTASPYPSVPRDGANDGWFEDARTSAAPVGHPPVGHPSYAQPNGYAYGRPPPPSGNDDGWF
jgi:hypothetical protein